MIAIIANTLATTLATTLAKCDIPLLMDSAKYLLNSFLTMTIAKDMIIMIEQGKKIN